MKLRAALLGVALLLAAAPASAALTTSERAQVRDFVARGRMENVGRVRSLVARTDLSTDESVAVVTDALVPLSFDESRAAFLRELMFGASSVGARPLLVNAVTRGLVARANAIFQRFVGGLDHEPRAIAELTAIYAFLDVTIANAGKPTSSAHDPSAGIPPATYDECSKVLRDHVEANARWLKGDGPIAEPVARVRAQAHVALLDMLPDGLTRRVDAADRMGLGAARRRILNDWGLLLEDAGKIDELGAERVRQLLAKLPSARADLELLFVGDPGREPLRARGNVVLASTAAADANPFGDEVGPAPIDPSTAGIALDLASLAAKRGLDAKADLRAIAERDAAAAGTDPKKLLGRPRAPSVDHVLGAAIQLLALDPQRAIDLAFARYVAGKPESAALLSDALGALSVATGSKEVDLGKPFTGIQLATNGAALGFTFDGHNWSLDRNPGVTAVRRDNQVVTIAMLPNAHLPLTDAGEWSASGATWKKLRGAPRAGVLAGDKGIEVKMVGGGSKGLDAITTTAPGADFTLECDLDVRGAEGGIVVRGVDGRETVRGAVLLVVPGTRVVLGTLDDTGNLTPIANAVEPDPKGPFHVKIAVKGTAIEVVVGAQTLKGNLPATVKRGDVGLAAKRGTQVRATGLSFKK